MVITEPISVQKAELHPEFSQDRNRKFILACKQVILESFQVSCSPEKRIVIIFLLFHYESKTAHSY